MPPNLLNPLIVQSDQTLLVEVDNPRYEAVREALARFAELVKSPEHIHTYRITPLSIWNAHTAGITLEWILDTLHQFAKYPVPLVVESQLTSYSSRYGKIKLISDARGFVLLIQDELFLLEIENRTELAHLLTRKLSKKEFLIEPVHRGKLKQTLIRLGYPVEDLAGYKEGEHLSMSARSLTLRKYQQEAIDVFGGSGVIVLPCGAGKTVVGIACMTKLQTSTLVLTTNVTATRQWVAEILDKTTLTPEEVGEYNGSCKEIRPVTVATYNILTWRENRLHDFHHLELFDRRDWGLIIYDEVHLLPAPVFQVTAGLQARRRLGLTATLVREDGCEGDVFALIGPKKIDIPWKTLENEGWIAKASCHEIRVPMSKSLMMRYALAGNRDKFRIASENLAKTEMVRKIIRQHPGEATLVIGMYVEQLKIIAKELEAPLIVGSTPQKKRDMLFEQFKSGKIPVLVVSKVANFAIDLPDAKVAIQTSGTFGSRQEEAQRLGRILRPKAIQNRAYFYTLVSQETVEQEFALNRQMFLCEQGYEYRIWEAKQFEKTAVQ